MKFVLLHLQVINQVAATLQDSDRFHTFTEPPVTLVGGPTVITNFNGIVEL